MSPSVPCPPPCTPPSLLPPPSAMAALAVPWCLVTGSEGKDQFSGCNFSPGQKARGSEWGSLGHVNRCTQATNISDSCSWGESSVFTPKTGEDPKPLVLESSRDLKVPNPQRKCSSTAPSITLDSVPVSWGSCADIYTCPSLQLA